MEETKIIEKKNVWSDAYRTKVKNAISAPLTDAEFSVFEHVCTEVNLDPVRKQIYALKKGGKLTIITSIDGFRIVAERTGKYAPGKDTEFMYKDNVLVGAKVFVKKLTVDGTWHDVSATALLKEYRGNTPIWGSMPHVMIEKCFSEDTQVLTSSGFRYFSEITDEEILEVNNDTLTAVKAIPFSIEYEGDMIEINSQKLDFSVTPNHDMVTTIGKVEASALYETTHNRGPWKIPMRIKTGKDNDAVLNEYNLIGYILADGVKSGNSWKIEVSRKYKRDILDVYEGAFSGIRRCAGNIAKTKTRNIVTNFDKHVYVFDNNGLVESFISDNKQINLKALQGLSSAEAKAIIDSWQCFDGHTNKKTGVRRIYTSNEQHCDAIEILSCMAGYSISTRKSRESDISSKDGYYYTISSVSEIKVLPPISENPGITKRKNITNKVWCVTVPSGKIIVRRNGFSMICGNCAESRALRRAFPDALGGLYTDDEMEQADIVEVKTIDDTSDIVSILDGKPSIRAQIEKRYGSLGNIPKEDYAKVINYAKAQPVEVNDEN